jgi:hypothetical protein
VSVLSRIWQEIVERPEGPMAFRFYLQPLVAAILAFRDGARDSREGRPPYFWAIFTDRDHRSDRIRDGWRSIRKVFVIAVALDVVYQIFFLHGLRPVEGLFVAAVLAIVPYVLLRGPANRLARRRRRATA